MEWNKALELSILSHRAHYLSFIAWALDVTLETIAEIGVNKGESSHIFRTHFPNAHLFLIDPWQPCSEYLISGTPISRKLKHYEKAYRNTLNLFQNDPHTTILRKTSLEATEHTPNNLDLVFIDANHTYTHVKENSLAWLPKVRPGGIVAGHDYDDTIPMFSGVKSAVDEIFKGKILIGKDRLWIYKKPNIAPYTL